MGDDIIECLKQLVEWRMGLSIRIEDSEALRKTIITRMKIFNMASPEEYLYLLASDTGASEQEWRALAPRLTIGESYFFRDKGHVSLLHHTILPDLIEKKQNLRSLRIWSAGCATGEEPYTIAIILDMILPDMDQWDIVILGTDINEKLLKKAERGVYEDWSFRSIDNAIKHTYFSKNKESWEIAERIKKIVTFQYGNLNQANIFTKYPEMGSVDLIICRNVFIYFNAEAVAFVCNNFIKALHHDGYLITGHGELHGHKLMNLRQVMYCEAVIYKKEVPLKKKIKEPAKKFKSLPFRDNIDFKSDRAVTKEKTEEKLHDQTMELENLVDQGRYTEAVAKTKEYLHANKEDYKIWLLLAQAYANSGDYDNAEVCCQRALKINSDSADPYFLLANIAEIKGNDEEAIHLFIKTIYLNPYFIAAYCELSGLYERQNDGLRAKKFRNTAIELLVPLPCSALVQPYNITAEELLISIRNLTRQ